MTTLALGLRQLTVEDIELASRGGMRVTVTAEARARMQRARDVLDDHLARDIPVYGLNTGLGGNVGHRIPAEAASSLQADLVMARVAGIGDPLPVETCRAILFCRLAGLVQAGAGVSLPAFDLLAEMLNRDIVPVIPSRGSTGAGDLVQTMSLAAAAIGEGRVWVGGEMVATASALAAAGLAPVKLLPKDGLSIGSASSVACATAALSIAALDDLLRMQIATAALACQGFGAHPALFDERAVAARPAALQVRAARLLRHALEGSDFFGRRPAKVQDAVSFRALPQTIGSFLGALASARREVETETNAAADNPLVLGADGVVLSNANFLTASLALAFDTLAIATAQLATASVQRSIKLMTGRLSGLANYLSPQGGASAGFVPLQKSLAALHAEIRLKANPASIDGIVVSDMVEDLGVNTVLAVVKLDEQKGLMRWVIAIEAMLAAQAVDLRRAAEPGLTLSPVTQLVYGAVRAATPMLDRDRATGPDAAEVHDRLWSPATVGSLRDLSGELY